MVVKMMKWPPWPLLSSKKYQIIIVVGRIQGLDSERFESGQKRVLVEVKWKGLKGLTLGSFRRSVKRNFTRESNLSDDGVVEWDEEFRNVCNFFGTKESLFHPWEIAFTVFNGVNHGLKKSSSIIGTASLNVAEYVNNPEKKDLGFTIPLIVPGCDSKSSPSLNLSLSVLELRTSDALSETVQESASPLSVSPSSSEAPSTDKDDFVALKTGLRKVKTFTNYVSARKAKKAQCKGESSDGRNSDGSEDAAYLFDSDSLDDTCADGELEGKKDSGLKHSVSYEKLALANYAQKSFYSDINIDGDDDCLIYYSNRKSDVECSTVDNSGTSCSLQKLQQSSKHRILSWRKRKLSFRSFKTKGEPLLKKNYAEDGGDDIDFDRRQLSSSDESGYGWHKTDCSSTGRSSSEFGDDSFAVGSWERKEVISRDGFKKLQTQVFFASIDQRSERAAGESACTALVAVIADWLQSNRNEMPIKSEFNSLIRDGSSEWRNLCGNETYIHHFPDKHFDLETVLQAKIRPLTEVSEKSFIGFFHPEELEEGELDFLLGAMTFDNIWNEISRSASELPCNGESCSIYIVSWNDHFFVLKVERDAYYIIDTLGERLYEGCNQAYVLKFDKDTVIKRLPNETETQDEKPTIEKEQESNSKETKAKETVIVSTNESSDGEKEEDVCRGKESCKEYIKSFLAAIPLRQVQVDLKKGLITSMTLHQRLQIEFHYTVPLQPTLENPIEETVAEAPSMEWK